MHITPEVVDHHPGSPGCQRQGVLAAQAAACTRDNGHPALEIQTHDCCLSKDAALEATPLNARVR
jgi:hypothetical protein